MRREGGIIVRGSWSSRLWSWPTDCSRPVSRAAFQGSEAPKQWTSPARGAACLGPGSSCKAELADAVSAQWSSRPGPEGHEALTGLGLQRARRTRAQETAAVSSHACTCRGSSPRGPRCRPSSATAASRSPSTAACASWRPVPVKRAATRSSFGGWRACHALLQQRRLQLLQGSPLRKPRKVGGWSCTEDMDHAGHKSGA